jgi:hypothetical protein
MSLKSKLIVFLLILSSCFIARPAQAVLSKYTYSYDISQLEWQILNWTSAYRGTLTPGDPFTLERIEYNRKSSKVTVYLTGMPDLATDENLNKSLSGITNLFSRRFPGFDPATDLIINYKLMPDSGTEAVYKEYREGVFGDRQPDSEANSSGMRSSGMGY